jgi:prepilin-type N-terminal cleavage/methylation domain-containing protein
VRRFHFRTRSDTDGFTLLEVLSVLIILTILIVLFIPDLRQYMARASEARCIANMRAINIGLRGYLQDHRDIWPQGPSPAEEQLWETFWLTTLKPYGISDKTWQCPAIDAILAAQGAEKKDRPKVHYLPTMFTAEPGIANRWATQPWLIERADAHGQGPLIGFPDGSVKSFFKVLAEQGSR